MNKEKIEKIKDLLANSSTRDLGAEMCKSLIKENPIDAIRFNTNDVYLCTWFDEYESEIKKDFVKSKTVEIDTYMERDQIIVLEWNKSRIPEHKILMMENGFEIKQYVTIHLSFWDRIRVLFGAQFKVDCSHKVESETLVSRGDAKIRIGKEKRVNDWQMSSFEGLAPD